MTLHVTVPFDGTPVFRGHALMLRDARTHGWTGTLQSADRRKGVAERYGKRSQWWLYMAYWVWHLKGANPANAPGHSTHELRSDAVAYRGPVGRPLGWWQLGLDVSDSDGLLAALAKLGYSAWRPYTAGSEAHHVNLHRSPKRVLRKRGLLAKPKPARKPARVTRISKACVELVAGFEGFRSEPYQDAVGVWTIGYGHTKGVSASTKPWTQAHALAVLKRELNGSYARAVAALRLPLTQPMFDALVSFVYNVGPGYLRAGHTIGDALRKHDWKAAADAFLLYDVAGGKHLPGLARRRKAERVLFLKGVTR